MQRRSAMECIAQTFTHGFTLSVGLSSLMRPAQAVLLPALADAHETTGSQPPSLWLANVYKDGVDVRQYWVSEKYDGVRVLCNGQNLITRGGNTLKPPAWFCANWPSVAFEGELWASRAAFSAVTSVIQQSHASDEARQKLRIMVFDAPTHSGRLSERIRAYRELVKRINQPWVQAVEQSRVDNAKALHQLHAEKIKLGAEGLMLRLAEARYRSGRSDDQLKLKTQQDAEARVMAHIAGTGKYTGLLGALLVQTPQGQRFKIGSGLSDDERRSPPAVGKWITYRYRGLTEQGTPRFATFLRVNPDVAAGP